MHTYTRIGGRRRRLALTRWTLIIHVCQEQEYSDRYRIKNVKSNEKKKKKTQI